MEVIPFPRLAAPALRALASAGYTHLGELNGVPLAEIRALHGMGPKALGVLESALSEYGLALADDTPASSSPGRLTNR